MILVGIFICCRDGIFNHFISQVQGRLHIVICMSPVGDAFRSRCRMFPSLVNCCTIDWFTVWPREALLSVAKTFFEHVDLGNEDVKVCTQCSTTMLWYIVDSTIVGLFYFCNAKQHLFYTGADSNG